jgi:hypothetical protein
MLDLGRRDVHELDRAFAVENEVRRASEGDRVRSSLLNRGDRVRSSLFNRIVVD